MYRFLFEYKFPFPGDKHAKIQLLGCVVIAGLVPSLRKYQATTVAVTFYIHHQYMGESFPLGPQYHLVLSHFLNLNGSHSDRLVVISCCDFSLHFPSS